MKYYFRKGVFGLLYAILQTTKWITLVDSKTLEKRDVSYKELYDMLLNGTEVYNLFVHTAYIDSETQKSLNLSEECLRQHKGLTQGFHPAMYHNVDPDEPIPVSIQVYEHPDLSVHTDKVIIWKEGTIYYYVWYNGFKYQLIDAGDIVSFYFQGEKLMLGWVSTTYVIGTDIGAEDDVHVREKYECSISQARRELLFA